MENIQKKLLAKEGFKILVLNPPEDYKKMFPDFNKFRFVNEPENDCDLILLFVKNCAEVSAYNGVAVESLKTGGIFWIAYPKQSSGIKTDINRDRGWEPVYKSGFGPVSQIAIDKTWSAMRFRPESLIKRKEDSVIRKST